MFSSDVFHFFPFPSQFRERKSVDPGDSRPGDVQELGPNPKLNVPLVNVARKAYKKSVARLLEAGSDPNMQPAICFRIFCIILPFCRPAAFSLCEMCCVCSRGLFGLVSPGIPWLCCERTPLQSPAQTESLQRKDGRNHTSLCSALQSSCLTTLEVVKLLLFHGADANERDGHGKTPLHYAVVSKHHPTELIMELARAGARLSEAPAAAGLQTASHDKPCLLRMFLKFLHTSIHTRNQKRGDSWMTQDDSNNHYITFRS